jgi:outer membrane protein OmpA-like peptidoglycan-associated protein
MIPTRAALIILAATALSTATPAGACTAASVYFDLGSTIVTADGRAEIERLALALAWKRPDLHQVLLTSQTDTSGSPAANRALSQRRAEAVRDLLIANDVPARLIAIQALGEAPVARSIPQNVRDQSLRRVDLLMQLDAAAQERQLQEGQPIC